MNDKSITVGKYSWTCVNCAKENEVWTKEKEFVQKCSRCGVSVTVPGQKSK